MTAAPHTYFAHPLADVSPRAQIGAGTRIWQRTCVRDHARIGDNCNIGQGAYIDTHVIIGSCVKIQNQVSVFEGVELRDGVFVGPHVCFTNDLFPRAITLEGTLKGVDDWEITRTLVGFGASIGAASVIRCGVTIGAYALIGAGSVVTKDVPSHALVYGNPARQHGYVCRCARRLVQLSMRQGDIVGWCVSCQQECVITLASETLTSLEHLLGAGGSGRGEVPE